MFFDEAGAGQGSPAFNPKEVAAPEMLRARDPSPHAERRHYICCNIRVDLGREGVTIGFVEGVLSRM